MAAEALDEWLAIEAIYGEDAKLHSEDPVSYSITLVPNPGQDEDNHVCVEFKVTLPAGYPEEAAPDYELIDRKGLSNGISEITMLVDDAINESMGEQMIFTLSEVIKDWLLDHNVPEKSMHEEAMERLGGGSAAGSGGSAADEEQEPGEEEKLVGSAALLDVDLPHEPSGVSPLGYTRADQFTPERFQEWLRRFNSEQQKLEDAQKDDLEKQRAKDAPSVEQQFSGRQLFVLNLAKEVEPGALVGSAAPAAQASPAAPIAGGLLSMDSDAFLSALDDVVEEDEDEDLRRIFSPEALAAAKQQPPKKK